MRAIPALVKKEFIQVRRDPFMLRLIFLAPIIQLLILGYAVNFDVKSIPIAVFDHDRSQVSHELVTSFMAGEYFVLEPAQTHLTELEKGFKENRYRGVLVIPPDFGAVMEKGVGADVGFWVDGTNANSAAITLGYAGTIVHGFNSKYSHLPPVTLREKILYNPEGKTVYYMVPGIVGTLLTMITVLLTAMAIVRERELGTLEQVMVTPISKPAFILGKTVPFAILGFAEMSVALVVGTLWFGIPFVGSKVLLYALAFVYLLTTLGTGMFISTVCSTQQQSMFFAWFFSLFAILTSGFVTPIENMPKAIQYLTYLNPLRYFIKCIRGIMTVSYTHLTLPTKA